MRKKTVKVVKMHQFLLRAYNSQDFAQSQENFARSHDREIVTFRNSVRRGTSLSHALLSITCTTRGKTISARTWELGGFLANKIG